MRYSAEELNAGIDQMEALEVVDYNPQAVAESLAPGTGTAVLTKVCQVYKTVRPFILLVTSLFFIPQKWRDALRSFSTVMDGICPQG